MTGTIKIATALIAALPFVFSASNASAQSGYPDHAVKMVVGYPPGGPVDIIGRVMGDKLSEVWGQPVVI
jgi:tripartite-type tricarboxylate transporter receptor subunit TctC